MSDIATIPALYPHYTRTIRALNRALSRTIPYSVPRLTERAVRLICTTPAFDTLLIGVADDGTITGLDADYQTLSEKMGRDRDGYERFLTSLLSSRLGADNVALSTITFHAMAGREVCRVVVQPASEEVWVKEGAEEMFYVRIGNKSEPLKGSALTRYTRSRWP